MNKRLSIFLYLCIFLVIRSSAQIITVAAAADLRFAMTELTNEFNRSNPGIKVDVIYGSSGNLYQQIVNQAPFNVFFSADISYPQKLDSLHLTEGKPTLYAIGHLVLWSQALDVSKGIELLKDDKVKRIAIANPRVAPYGKRAVQCLNFYKIYDQVKDKIAEGENVSQAAQFVLSGNAEAGMIALSLALSPEMTKKGKYVLIDEKSYSKMEQAFVVIRKNETNKDVLKFIRFIESPAARKFFTKYGFGLPNEK
jgi:molybdate transport system substrate-binding protein